MDLELIFCAGGVEGAPLAPTLSIFMGGYDGSADGCLLGGFCSISLLFFFWRQNGNKLICLHFYAKLVSAL